jgi:hypothetical protein
MSQESFEEQQEALDPHRREELTGRETSAQLDDLMTAIDRFEASVIARGGDLFVNMPTSNPPENPEFVIPRRVPGEDAEAYAARINAAANRLEKVDL